MDRADEIVDKIMDDIKSLSGKKEILIKTVFLRLGVLAQFSQYFSSESKKTLNGQISLKQAMNFLENMDDATEAFQKYVEDTIKIIEDFDKEEQSKNRSKSKEKK